MSINKCFYCMGKDHCSEKCKKKVDDETLTDEEIESVDVNELIKQEDAYLVEHYGKI